MEFLNVINNTQQQQFQLPVNGEIAWLEYRFSDGMIVLMHTDVPDQLSGKGIGSALAAAAFDYAKNHHLKVKVYCPFVKTWLARHPDLLPLVVNPS
ncbi:MAG TPA: GNAT family N-acetyltransferase [Puia sp.]|nr:GNAT family N-acetyltransferase [Puia sp.]